MSSEKKVLTVPSISIARGNKGRMKKKIYEGKLLCHTFSRSSQQKQQENDTLTKEDKMQ